MKSIIVTTIMIIFPILMYLVFSCYNVLNNKKITKVIFIITICTSLYMSLSFNGYEDDIGVLLLFCNIPILICYFKKELLLGIILSVIVVLSSYLMYDVNIYIVSLKYLSYLVAYILLYRRKDFKYLFLRIGAIIQGFFISFEFFMREYNGIERLIDLIMYTVIIYSITFFCLYLFKLADNVASLYVTINKVTEENKLKNSLFKLTHEIKNPLAVCKGYLDMINFNNIDKSKKYIGIVKSEIDRSLNVMSDFMEYSKIKVKKEIIDINILLEELCESFELLLNDNKINLVYENTYDEIYLWGDYDRLKQVFVNIIKNAIEAITDGGEIKIGVKVEGKNINISVSDSGAGMDKEELDNIKEMFYTTKKNGTGLGVALSNEIILAHNGKMVYNSIKNKGTECVITLPM